MKIPDRGIGRGRDTRGPQPAVHDNAHALGRRLPQALVGQNMGELKNRFGRRQPEGAMRTAVRIPQPLVVLGSVMPSSDPAP